MKYIHLFLVLFSCLYWTSCSDDNEGYFDVTAGEVTFTPTEGGAVMHYTLADRRVCKVKVEYTDEFGEPVYKVGDYAVDTLVLDGFNRVHNQVPVRVSYLDKNDRESKAEFFVFDTRASVLYSFFEQVHVSSYWNGFQVSYDLNGRVDGAAAVYFVGMNPTTKLRDTILMENILLMQGKSVKAYSLDKSQQQADYTVMIVTEDNRQRVVRKQVWGGIENVEREMIPNKDFILHDPFHLSKEVEYDPDSKWNPGALSKKYLFDGDVKGTRAAQYFRPYRATPPFTFLAGPNALNTPENDVYFVLDIREPAIVGEMRLYMRIKDYYYNNDAFDNGYYTKLPCNIHVYAWNGEGDYDPEQNSGTKEDWEEIGSFEQDPNIAVELRWYVNKETQSTVSVETASELEALNPIYVSIPFPFEEKKYRFFKLQFDATYTSSSSPEYDHNNNNNVTFHELEIYGKK